ncbi:MAG: T9SS type A sorting domain-containing protein [Flavobacteriales bacterium]|nr:T9SS type A sorting domain-containing protein [Flavobacteriales bacterium]
MQHPFSFLSSPNTNLPMLRSIGLCLSLLICFHTSAQSWSAPVEVTDARGSGGNVGEYCSTEIVNGHPAMASVDGDHDRIVWVRANDAEGSDWPAPIFIGAPGIQGAGLSMMEVNSRPAIAFFQGNRLMYVRANDPNGDAWGTPVMIDSVANSVLDHVASMDIVNGKPAIAYVDHPSAQYVQALDPDGTSWASPVVIPGLAAGRLVLEVVNGNPAIAFSRVDNIVGGARYVRANNADGTLWGSVVALALQDADCISLRMVGGVPSVVYLNADPFDGRLKYQRANDVNGASWGAPVNVSVDVLPILSCDLLVVDGFPAIAYQRTDTDQILYNRGTSVLGAWLAPVVIEAYTIAASYATLIVVNGSPAVGYAEGETLSTMRMAFARATELTGTAAWDAPINITSYPDVGQHVSQAIVDGFPALAYYDATNKDLRYVRALDSLGTAWGVSGTIDSVTACGQYTSMAVVNGRPAITYYDETFNLKYVRANDALGATWGTPVLLPATPASYGQSTSLAIIAGRPAVAFVSSSPAHVRYIRALDADGTTWPATSVNIAGNSGIGVGISMIELSGMPAVAYYGFNADMMFHKALDVDGASWATAVNIDATGAVGQYPSLAIVNGTPAVSYYDQTNGDLKFARANSAAGTNWPFVEIADNDVDAGQHSTLLEVGGYATIAYGPGVRMVQAVNANGNAWGAPIILSTPSSSPRYASMLKNGSALGISFYDELDGYPYYLSGAQCALGTPQPTSTTLPEGLLACYGGTTTLSATGTNLSWHNQNDDVLGIGNSYTTAPLTSNTILYATDSTCYLSLRRFFTVVVATQINTGASVNGNSITALANGANYQWIDCFNGSAPIPNATAQTYDAPVSGSYAVIVTVNACSDTSACEAIITTSVDLSQGHDQVNVFPNPAHRVLNIRIYAPGLFELTLLDASGREVLSVNSPQPLSMLDVADLQRGYYILKVRTAATVTAHRVVLE